MKLACNTHSSTMRGSRSPRFAYGQAGAGGFGADLEKFFRSHPVGHAPVRNAQAWRSYRAIFTRTGSRAHARMASQSRKSPSGLPLDLRMALLTPERLS